MADGGITLNVLEILVNDVRDTEVGGMKGKNNGNNILGPSVGKGIKIAELLGLKV